MGKTKKPRENQKTKKTKTFQRMFGLRFMFVFFWCSSSFFVFLVMTLKKTKKLKVFWVFWINWWLKTCEKPKKIRSFLFFCLDGFYMSSENLSKNQKRPEFFGFFALLQVRVPSKNQKNLEFFKFFQGHDKKNKKNSRKTKKKQTWTSDQTFSEKFWFFVFLVFSRFFWFWFWFRGLWWVRLLIFSSGFWFGSLWRVHGYLGNTFEKQFPLAGFGIHYFPKKTAFPKIIPAIYFKPLSSKTGLFKGK